MKELGAGQGGEDRARSMGDGLVYGIVPSPPEGLAQQQLELRLLEHRPQETVGNSASKQLGCLTNFWTASLALVGNQALNSVTSRPRAAELRGFHPGPPLGES